MIGCYSIYVDHIWTVLAQTESWSKRKFLTFRVFCYYAFSFLVRLGLDRKMDETMVKEEEVDTAEVATIMA